MSASLEARKEFSEKNHDQTMLKRFRSAQVQSKNAWKLTFKSLVNAWTWSLLCHEWQFAASNSIERVSFVSPTSQSQFHAIDNRSEWECNSRECKWQPDNGKVRAQKRKKIVFNWNLMRWHLAIIGTMSENSEQIILIFCGFFSLSSRPKIDRWIVH